MTMPTTDKLFTGAVAQVYETHMVPLIFEPYAADLVARLCSRSPARVLELAAGTGVVTRRMARELPAASAITATDLNPGMLEQARAAGTARPVTWQQADALALPFDDGSFDAVVCQFGVMFFPDKPRGFAEARRVLAKGGLFLFNVWSKIELNDFAETVESVLVREFPNDPPRFMSRTPHGYWDADVIAGHLRSGGFTATPSFDAVAATSRAASARDAAFAYTQGTPMRDELERRAPDRLDAVTDAAAGALASRYGDGPVEGRIHAVVVSVER